MKNVLVFVLTATRPNYASLVPLVSVSLGRASAERRADSALQLPLLPRLLPPLLIRCSWCWRANSASLQQRCAIVCGSLLALLLSSRRSRCCSALFQLLSHRSAPDVSRCAPNAAGAGGVWVRAEVERGAGRGQIHHAGKATPGR